MTSRKTAEGQLTLHDVFSIRAAKSGLFKPAIPAELSPKPPPQPQPENRGPGRPPKLPQLPPGTDQLASTTMPKGDPLEDVIIIDASPAKDTPEAGNGSSPIPASKRQIAPTAKLSARAWTCGSPAAQMTQMSMRRTAGMRTPPPDLAAQAELSRGVSGLAHSFERL